MDGISVREYAIKEGISLGTAYRRLWEGRAAARKCEGRWVVTPRSSSEDREHPEPTTSNDEGGAINGL
jgi:hypothetical protein